MWTSTHVCVLTRSTCTLYARTHTMYMYYITQKHKLLAEILNFVYQSQAQDSTEMLVTTLMFQFHHAQWNNTLIFMTATLNDHLTITPWQMNPLLRWPGQRWGYSSVVVMVMFHTCFQALQSDWQMGYTPEWWGLTEQELPTASMPCSQLSERIKVYINSQPRPQSIPSFSTLCDKIGRARQLK